LFVATAVTLGGFEAALRLFLPQKLYRFPPGIVRNDDDLVFTLAPGFRGRLRNPEYTTEVSINSLGLRGPEPEPKRLGFRRILVLGDSFVSAFNMNEADTLVSVAERALKRTAAGDRLEVVNAGTPNYGTWHELRLFRRLAPLLHPDAVILCVYTGNDVENNLRPREVVVENGLLVSRKPVPGIIPLGLRSWLQRESMTYVFLWNAWNQIRPSLGRTGSDPLKEFKDLVSRQPVSYLEDGYRITDDLLSLFRDEARHRELPLLIVLIPAEYQVYGRQFDDMVKHQGLDPEDFDLDLPDRRWAGMAKRLALPVLDLLPVFRSREAGPYLYMSLDGHLTREGNRIAGEAIADALAHLLGGGSPGRSQS
jgi:lysophospholipase L1-like esterase